MPNTIEKTKIGQEINPKDDKFYKGTVLGIMHRDNLPDQYLIGYKDGQPRHPDSWKNSGRNFPDWIVARNIRSYSYFIVVGGKLILQ